MSQALYFVYDGQVEVSYKDNENVLLIYDQGSYIGDTSYIFQIRNQYRYRQAPSKDGKTPFRVYSLQDKYLQDIFGNFPQFKDVLKVRGLRRHHYLRKLKDQQQ